MGRAIVALMLIACSAAAFFLMRQTSSQQAETAPKSNPNNKENEVPPKIPAAIQYVEFARSDLTDKMILEVVRMVRPNRVQASIETTQFGRLAFVIVEGAERIYEMEPDLLPQYEPVMKELGLSPATGIGTRVLSRYRSVSKTGMAFDEKKDRMIVIVAPFIEWSKIRLPKPDPVLMLKS